jgi:tartrate dehydratase beta subunit/fumarate hydratase class I family protein
MSHFILTAPFSDILIASFKAGDEILLSGTIYTARDAAS